MKSIEITDLIYKITSDFFIIVDLIFWFMFLSAVTGIILLTHKKHKKTLVGWLLIGISSVFIATSVYGSTVEQVNIKIREETIDLEDYNGKPVSFILVSDLHLGRYLNSAKLPVIVNKINSIEKSDTVLILGDVVNENSIFLSHLDYLENIDKSVYFVYGNHDYVNKEPPVRKVEGLGDKLGELEFNVLENEVIDFDETVKIAGIKDLWSHEQDFSMLEKVTKDDTVILMSHSPDGVLELEYSEYFDKVDLVVSGHTHGGEIRLPGTGSIWFIPIKLPKEYDKGLNYYKEIPVFVTSGVGSVGSRVRLFNPSEIVVLTIE